MTEPAFVISNQCASEIKQGMAEKTVTLEVVVLFKAPATATSKQTNTLTCEFMLVSHKRQSEWHDHHCSVSDKSFVNLII